MPKKTLANLPGGSLRGVPVLVRADYNVPLEGGTVADGSRIERTLPTLRRLESDGARGILLAHLGRPGGVPVPELSLEPVADALAELLGRKVAFCRETVGPEALGAARALNEGEFLLLENTRFLPGETANDPELAAAMAELGNAYVNDAFGTAHRAHASTAGLARAIRKGGGEAVAGFLMEREVRFLKDALEHPARPFVAVLGGAKISGKIDVIRALLPQVDRLLLGGAMANTFFRALGLETGDSLVEEGRLEMAREILEEGGEKVLLPVDVVVAPRIEKDAPTEEKPRSRVAMGEAIGDVGSRTRELFGDEIRRARSVVWNGPMGVFEVPRLSGGTEAVARALAEVTDAGGLTVVGGGDSAAATEAAGLSHRMTHVSTGGGASLQLLGGGSLPGLEALSDLRED